MTESEYTIGKIEFHSHPHAFGIHPPVGWESNVGINNFVDGEPYVLVSNTGELYVGLYSTVDGGFTTSSGVLGSIFIKYYIQLPSLR